MRLVWGQENALPRAWCIVVVAASEADAGED